MPLSYDALVVGAGYVGCAVAAELAAAGLRTALIERTMPGSGASGANYGSVQVQDTELSASLPLTVAGKACFDGLDERLGDDTGYRSRGSLLLIETEAQWQVMAGRIPALQRAGIRAELVPARHLPEIEPLLDPRAALGACYHPHEGQVWPFRFMQAYLRYGRRHGLQLHAGTEVTGFVQHGGRLVGLHTSRGTFHAPLAVLATGAWSAGLGRLLGRDWAIPFVHGEALVTERSELALRNHVASAAFFETLHAENADRRSGAILAVGQSPYGHLLLGEAATTTAEPGSRATLGGQAAIAVEVARFFPAFNARRVLRGWASPVAFTSDGLPYLGPVEGIAGLILATAFKSTVIATPLAARLVAQLALAGRAELDVAAFSPQRVRAAG